MRGYVANEKWNNIRAYLLKVDGHSYDTGCLINMKKST